MRPIPQHVVSRQSRQHKARFHASGCVEDAWETKTGCSSGYTQPLQSRSLTLLSDRLAPRLGIALHQPALAGRAGGTEVPAGRRRSVGDRSRVTGRAARQPESHSLCTLRPCRAIGRAALILRCENRHRCLARPTIYTGRMRAGPRRFRVRSTWSRTGQSTSACRVGGPEMPDHFVGRHPIRRGDRAGAVALQ